MGGQVAENVDHPGADAAPVAEIAEAQQHQLHDGQQEHRPVQRPPAVAACRVIVKQNAGEQVQDHQRKVYRCQTGDGRRGFLHAPLVVDMLQCQAEEEQGVQGAGGDGDGEIAAVEKFTQPEGDGTGAVVEENGDDIQEGIKAAEAVRQYRNSFRLAVKATCHS